MPLLDVTECHSYYWKNKEIAGKNSLAHLCTVWT